MTDHPPPSSGSRRFANLLLGLIALMAVIVVGAAWAERRLDLALLAVGLIVIGIPLAYWTRRLRDSLTDHPPPKR